MKIYTKTGDQGQTSLFGGKRVDKHDIQIEAYGTVDELNSAIGLLLSKVEDTSLEDTLKAVQSILFDIGSHLASDGTATSFLPEIKAELSIQLEEDIDRMNTELPKLTSFILPGGNERIATCHLARTICRRAERRVVALGQAVDLNPSLLIYLNRLSDHLFVAARYLAMLDGIDEVKWNAK